MAVKPLLHRILVQQEDLSNVDPMFAAAKRMGFEIAFAEQNREQAAVDRGVVLEVGPTAFKDFGLSEAPIKKGDTVVYARYAGKTVEDPTTKQKLVALNDEDIVAVITQD